MEKIFSLKMTPNSFGRKERNSALFWRFKVKKIIENSFTHANNRNSQYKAMQMKTHQTQLYN